MPFASPSWTRHHIELQYPTSLEPPLEMVSCSNDAKIYSEGPRWDFYREA